MWIEKLKNGKYKFVERYEDPYTGKTKRVSITLKNQTNQTKRLAQEILDKKNSRESADRKYYYF